MEDTQLNLDQEISTLGIRLAKKTAFRLVFHSIAILANQAPNFIEQVSN